ncbi:MAG TPA: BsuPI-related putative proteinase inhibitor [Actinomycetota bacterium]|nr:BsuPI-related putative proteinase inhibitor [Actinomycetota bacterium]
MTRVLIVAALLGACVQEKEAVQQRAPRTTIDRTSPAPEGAGPAANPGQAAPTAPLEFTDCPPKLNPVAPPSGVEVTLSLGKEAFSRDEVVPLVLKIKNASEKGVERTWARGQLEREYWITNDKGTVWRWTYGDELSGAAGTTVYEPNEERVFAEEWPAKDPASGASYMVVCWGDAKRGVPRVPGKYAAQAFLAHNDQHWLSNGVQFEIK